MKVKLKKGDKPEQGTPSYEKAKAEASKKAVIKLRKATQVLK